MLALFNPIAPKTIRTDKRAHALNTRVWAVSLETRCCVLHPTGSSNVSQRAGSPCPDLCRQPTHILGWHPSTAGLGGCSYVFSLAGGGSDLGNIDSWTGAEFGVQNNGVIVSMSDDRVSKIRARLEEALRAKGMVAGLEKLAGELSWVAGLILRIRPFCSHSWAAIHEIAAAHARHRRASTRKRQKNLVFIRQVRHALVWLLRFVEGERGGLRRVYITPRSKFVTAVLRTDASTTGMAGNFADQQWRVLEYWADPIGDVDRRWFRAEAGESAFMPEFELLTILVSIKVWGPRLQGGNVGLVLQGDAVAALTAAINLTGRTPLLNALAAEVALQLELNRWDCLFGEHVRSELNVEADKLSRLWDDVTVSQVVPGTLQNVVRICAPPRDSAFMIAWPQDW